mgnify:CR=1 FL=1
MGGCMAPAACDTIYRNFCDFGRTPDDYDAIFTGDLGAVGKRILLDLLKEKGYDPETVQAVDWKSYKEEQYDKLADIVRASLDMEEIYRIIGL